MIEPDLIVNAVLGTGLTGALTVAVAQWRGRLDAEKKSREAAVAAQGELRRQKAQLEQVFQAELAGLHQQLSEVARWYQFGEEEIGHLLKLRLPAVIDAEVRRYQGVVVPGPLHPGLKGPFETLHESVVELLLPVVEETRTKVARSARAGVRGIADEAQTHLARLQETIFQELRKHPDATEYHQSLFDIDRVVTRALHALQRLRVLAGSWPGMQRADATFSEVVESARGRIGQYDRVKYNYQRETGEQYVEGRVIEPIAMALAELMENGASCSPQEVDVYLRKETTGYQVVVEDGGGGMNTFQREAADRILSSRTVLDVTTLEDERKLGFPVVALLSQRYGFRADVSAPSIRGGVKAVLFVPSHLFASPPDKVGTGPAASDTPGALPPEQPAAQAESAAGDALPAAGSTTGSGLPKRRRVLRPDPRPEPPVQEPLTDTYDPQAIDAGFAHVTQALRAGYDLTEETNNDDQ